MATVETQGIQTSQRRMHRFQLPGGGELIIKRAIDMTGRWVVIFTGDTGIVTRQVGGKTFSLESQALTYATRWLEWE